MAQTQTEFFGHFVYGPDLTYEELLAREEALKEALAAILAASGADYSHFEADGDSLRVQCGLTGQGEDLFHAVCDRIAPLMEKGLDGRLLFVDKALHALHAYSLHQGKWQEGVILLPPPGHLEKADPVELIAAEPVGAKKRAKKAAQK